MQSSQPITWLLLTNNKEKTQYKSQNTHKHNTNQRKQTTKHTAETKNYPDSVASYDTQPGNEVGLFYNGPEHHTGQIFWQCAIQIYTLLYLL